MTIFPKSDDFPSRALAILTGADGTRAAAEFVVHGRAAVGCGIGLMVANKIRNDTARQATAVTLLSLGLLATLPGVVGWVVRALDRPESERGSQRRLRSIREGYGLEPESELF